MPALAKITTSVGLIVIISLFMRGLGRKQSRSYSNMMKALVHARQAKTAGDANSELRRFDIEFKAWPVDFDVKALTGLVFLALYSVSILRCFFQGHQEARSYSQQEGATQVGHLAL